MSPRGLLALGFYGGVRVTDGHRGRRGSRTARLIVLRGKEGSTLLPRRHVPFLRAPPQGHTWPQTLFFTPQEWYLVSNYHPG